jgi:hypothetical protein
MDAKNLAGFQSFNRAHLSVDNHKMQHLYMKLMAPTQTPNACSSPGPLHKLDGQTPFCKQTSTPKRELHTHKHN